MLLQDMPILALFGLRLTLALRPTTYEYVSRTNKIIIAELALPIPPSSMFHNPEYRRVLYLTRPLFLYPLVSVVCTLVKKLYHTCSVSHCYMQEMTPLSASAIAYSG